MKKLIYVLLLAVGATFFAAAPAADAAPVIHATQARLVKAKKSHKARTHKNAKRHHKGKKK